MPGMGGGSPSTDNPVVVSAFHAALRHQAIIVLVLLALALLARLVAGQLNAPRPAPAPEHPARRLLRISLGILWIVDGALQAQQAMPLGLPTQVVGPAAAGSPGWLHRLVADGLAIWTHHPVTAAAATVWIQIGVGCLLLLVPRGRLSQVAALPGVAWGLLVWVFGEALGGMLAPGASWLFGAPGAAVLYAAGGALLALPERRWEDRRLGRAVLAGYGILLVGMAVLQAWPGQGWWRGNEAGGAGSLLAMVRAMATTPQPRWLSSLLRAFAGFDAAHGWAVNLWLVASLAAIGVALLTGRRRLVAAATVYGVGLWLATWVLVQDLGVFGGVGTDPNSMLPAALLLVAGWLAWTRAPAPAPAPTLRPTTEAAVQEAEPVGPPAPAGAPAWIRRLGVSAGLGLVSAAAAVGVALVGLVPMAFASLDPHTAAIVTEAVNGLPQSGDGPAPAFRLEDQRGRPVSLADLHGRTVVLTFLDPVCTSDCPLIAQELRQVDARLGDRPDTAFVAIVANPVYRATEFARAFDAQEHLSGLPNWYFLTGSTRQLQRVWRAYGIQVQQLGGGSMIAHSDQAYIIDRAGRIREVLGTDPGAGTASTSSLATLITGDMRTVMRA